MLSLNDIREKYLNFFEAREHLRLPSFPLVPQSDPSLLLIGSGMAPMKPYFTGEQTPPSRRITTCQKCVRVIDIEEVGMTSRHCTFFEMLGHFSFGDYFKREAIAWTWEFYTKIMGINPEVLYPSVFEEDDETYHIWINEMGIPASRVFKLGKKDNFWDVGSGPCGPCSEVYFDRGETNGCGSQNCQPGCDCDRFIEIGNNVFTQFSNDGANNYTELSQKNIDYGGGLERLAMVVQGVSSVFEVDTFQRITRHVERVSGVTHGESAASDISLRIITDHIRSTVFLVCDGVLPSNEGRGYVLRRLLRRAARHGKLLGVQKPFLCEVAETVIKESGSAYPELIEKRERIQSIIRAEEERFAATIDAGLRLCHDMIGKTKSSGQTVFSGEDAFMLYDTYGFPVDLTLELLREQGLSLDRGAFDAAMEAQRERARAARGTISGWGAEDDYGLPGGATAFIGYDSLEEPATVLAVLHIEDGRNAVLLDKTPFYAESGGQVSDHGTIGSMVVEEVKKLPDGKIIHIGTGSISASEKVMASVDAERRRAIARAHTATHLLHAALRKVLGDHVAQAGSLVEPDKLRLDFTHHEAVTPAQLREVDTLMHLYSVFHNPITACEMPIDEARALGAMALFGEKYGDTVRVVHIDDVSIELCGGAHLTSSSLIGGFYVLSESSVAAGVRRIEAVTGWNLIIHRREQVEMLYELRDLLGGTTGDLPMRIMKLQADHRALQRELESLKAKSLGSDADELFAASVPAGTLRVVTAIRSDLAAEGLRTLGDFLRVKDQNLAAVLASVHDGKITVTAACGDGAIQKGIKAGDLVKLFCAATGGSGGGKPSSAMGGGGDPAKLNAAMAQVLAYVKERG
jgi:alanyl-tRNA synthetase